MTRGASRLSLGALPRSEVVKLTITLSTDLKAQLDVYAEVHAQVHQVPVDPVVLIPHMLAAFIARDRGFRTLRSKGADLVHKSQTVIGGTSNTSDN